MGGARREASRSGWRRRGGSWRGRCGGRLRAERIDGLRVGCRGRAASPESLAETVRSAVLDGRFREADDGERDERGAGGAARRGGLLSKAGSGRADLVERVSMGSSVYCPCTEERFPRWEERRVGK